MPCFTATPIACVFITQGLGVIIRDEVRAYQIRPSHVVLSKSRGSAISQ